MKQLGETRVVKLLIKEFDDSCGSVVTKSEFLQNPVEQKVTLVCRNEIHCEKKTFVLKIKIIAHIYEKQN
jgi:hypothetical protein